MEDQIKITLSDMTIDEINCILLALQELPAKVCNPLSAKLKGQAEAQLPKEPTPQE